MKAILSLSVFFAAGSALPFFHKGHSTPTRAPPAPLPQAGSISAREITISLDATLSLLSTDLLNVAAGISSCDGASYANECRTASQAAGPIFRSFTKYGVTNTNERAALVALMLYESGEFKYNWGHYVGGQTVHTPGKGTRNMQSAAYNEEYARTLFAASKVDAAKASGGADGVLQLVSPDETSFASAAWFLTSQCEQSVRSGLQAGTQDGFEQYVTGCIGGTMDQSRIDYWTKATAALAG